jgi:hypothetical protein
MKVKLIALTLLFTTVNAWAGRGCLYCNSNELEVSNVVSRKNQGPSDLRCTYRILGNYDDRLLAEIKTKFAEKGYRYNRNGTYAFAVNGAEASGTSGIDPFQKVSFAHANYVFMDVTTLKNQSVEVLFSAVFNSKSKRIEVRESIFGKVTLADAYEAAIDEIESCRVRNVK